MWLSCPGISGAGPTVSSDKMYQYMAAGVPVVATPTPQMTRFSEEIELARDSEKFAEAVERCLCEDNRWRVTRQTEIARGETWDHRAQGQLALMQDCLERKLGGKINA